jgi:hypothetical protein
MDKTTSLSNIQNKELYVGEGKIEQTLPWQEEKRKSKIIPIEKFCSNLLGGELGLLLAWSQQKEIRNHSYCDFANMKRESFTDGISRCQKNVRNLQTLSYKK